MFLSSKMKDCIWNIEINVQNIHLYSNFAFHFILFFLFIHFSIGKNSLFFYLCLIDNKSDGNKMVNMAWACKSIARIQRHKRCAFSRTFRNSSTNNWSREVRFSDFFWRLGVLRARLLILFTLLLTPSLFSSVLSHPQTVLTNTRPARVRQRVQSHSSCFTVCETFQTNFDVK